MTERMKNDGTVFENKKVEVTMKKKIRNFLYVSRVGMKDCEHPRIMHAHKNLWS